MKRVTIFVILLISILYFRSFIWLVNAWLTEPCYSHGFLIPIISGFIVWRNLRNKKGMKVIRWTKLKQSKQNLLNQESTSSLLGLSSMSLALSTSSLSYPHYLSYSA